MATAARPDSGLYPEFACSKGQKYGRNNNQSHGFNYATDSL
ncbi:hypothetical protein BMETH_1761_0 [methanotrophic bacterial endosymbiont of Bathymodiolus sp.]|nr:hypothetical protein BMETH_1761_0 [methanotrophic bacterial endosymbiont of Bathymodiolus sp.]